MTAQCQIFHTWLQNAGGESHGQLCQKQRRDLITQEQLPDVGLQRAEGHCSLEEGQFLCYDSDGRQTAYSLQGYVLQGNLVAALSQSVPAPSREEAS